MTDRISNFENINGKILQYKSLSKTLKEYKSELDEILLKLKDIRKQTTYKGGNEEILKLNSRRDFLKDEISDKKRLTKNLYNECESLIFEGLKNGYSDVFDSLLSRLYGSKIEIINKEIGEDYDSKDCIAINMIVTKNPKQHAKILKTINYGIKDISNNIIEKKALVEICVYSRKLPLGAQVPFDAELL